MKKQGLLLIASFILTLAGCGNTPDNSNAAAVPQSCGNTGIPNQYCSPYNTAGYGVGAGYCNSTSSTYGWGNSQPCYYEGMNYGCPYGSQPVASGWGGQEYCAQTSYLSGLGYSPTYAANYTWSNGRVGYGPQVFGCNPNRPGSCGVGVCRAVGNGIFSCQ